MTQAIATREENKARIQPVEDVVASTVGGLREVMQGLLADGVVEIVLDLTNVQMMDSRGIGLLISAHNSLRQRGGTFAVVHASKDILELLRTMRIHQHFSVSGD